MDMGELMAIHSDSADGEIIEELIFEMTADKNDSDSAIEFTNCYFEYLDGAILEGLFPEKDCLTAYFSVRKKDGVHCYFIRYTPAKTQIFEIKPAKGVLTE